jgi:hypothetical protein
LREQIISRATAEIGSMLATGSDRTGAAQSESRRSAAEPVPS